MNKNAAARPTFKIFAPLLKASLGPDGKKRLHGVASSSVKDRHGDMITNSALTDMERSASENMTIFLNHEYKVPEDVAGSVERAFIRSHPQDPEIRDLVLDIVVNETNPRAVSAWEAIDGGTKLGLSIGAMIPDGGASRDRKSGSYVIDHVELLETSLVGVPANPRSWVEYAIKSLNLSWIDPDAEPGVVERSDGQQGIVVEIDEAEAEKAVRVDGTGGFEAEDFEHKDDPPEFPEEPVAESPAEEPAPEETETRSSGSGTWTTTPDTTNATVSIEMPNGGKVHIDTGNRGSKPASSDGSSQEALASAPETEDEDETEKGPWDGILPVKSGDDLLDEDITSALQALEPTVVASLRTSNEVLRAVTRELTETKEALRARNEEYAALEEETKRVLSETAQILDKLSSTPIGRRAVIREVGEDFASLREVYGEQFVNILKRS